MIFFMMKERCRSSETLPSAAATTLRHLLNSNYSVWLISQLDSSEQSVFLGVKSILKAEFDCRGATVS